MTLISTIILLVLLTTATSAMNGEPQHGLLTSVLTSHVSGGRVDYNAVKRDRRFAMYLSALSTSRPDTMSAQQQKAFWINAYNAFAIKLVCDNYPLTSIRDLDKGQILERLMFRVDTGMYSLRSIVVDRLLPLRDTRIYAALVFAARGCPPLRTEAYEPSRIDAQLDNQASLFAGDTTRNVVAYTTRQASLSRIFEWNLPAFGTSYQQVVAAVLAWQHNATSELPPSTQNWTVTFREFDWTLNGK